MKKTTSRKITVISGWLISIGLMTVLILKLNMHKAMHGFTNANMGFLLLAATINIAVVAMKSSRWQWLMKPAKASKFWDIFKATMIGFAANNIMPARGGDILKIFLINKWEKVGKTTLLSITFMDKIFEGIAMIALFAVLFTFRPPFPSWINKAGMIIAFTTIFAVTISIVVMLHSKINRSKTGRLHKIIANIAIGMKGIGNFSGISTISALSLLSCFTQILTIWSCQKAFGIESGIWLPIIIYIAVNMSVALPSAPSGVGPFEAAMVIAYTQLGVDAETGFNIALTYHLVQFIPVTLIGAAFYWLSVWHNTSYNRAEAIEK